MDEEDNRIVKIKPKVSKSNPKNVVVESPKDQETSKAVVPSNKGPNKNIKKTGNRTSKKSNVKGQSKKKREMKNVEFLLPVPWDATVPTSRANPLNIEGDPVKTRIRIGSIHHDQYDSNGHPLFTYPTEDNPLSNSPGVAVSPKDMDISPKVNTTWY